MSLSSGGAVLALAFVPVLWAAIGWRRRAVAMGESQRPLRLAALASLGLLAIGGALAISTAAFY